MNVLIEETRQLKYVIWGLQRAEKAREGGIGGVIFCFVIVGK